MLRRALSPFVLVAAVAGATAATPITSAALKWPPWLSIESPVNPYDAAARGAAFLVHAAMREGIPALADLSGTAEGMVDGARRSLPVEFAATSRPGVFSVRRTWPGAGPWVVRISLRSTTALVALGRDGSVASVRIPTEHTASGDVIPRAVTSRDVDSTLAALANR